MHRFDWSSAPMSSYSTVIITTICYLFVILSHLSSPKFREVFRLPGTKPLISAHNLVLCVASLGMFLGCLSEVIKRSKVEHGIDWMFCEHEETRPVGALWWYAYVYYLSKYYELLDTFLQLASGKTPPNYFLHVYHHSLVMTMSWVWLETTASLQFVGLLFNTAVHVVMYFYYFLRSIGISPWWKNYVTLFQIVQFVTSLVAFVITVLFQYGFVPNHPAGQCKGMGSVYGSIIFNATLLYGFVGILFPGKGKGGKGGSKVKGPAAGDKIEDNKKVE